METPSDPNPSAFAALSGLAPLRIWDGVTAWAVEGEQGTLALIELAPNSAVPEHSHANEQLGVCVSGSGRFRIGDEEREIGAGDTWRILGGVPHELVTGPQGALMLECFSPARLEWGALERLSGTPAPHWP